MRITISSGHDSIVLANNPADRWQPYWIVAGGVEGLYGPTAVREKGVAMPQQDGDYWPSRLTHEGRTITLKCAGSASSSVEAAVKLRRLAALSGEHLAIGVEDESGRTHMEGWLAGDMDATLIFSRDCFTFTLILYCPDPLRYGDEVSFGTVGGVCRVENAGGVPVWPWVRVAGPIRSLRVSLGSRRVQWSGDADGLDFDFRDMVPSSGTVTRDDAFRIPPGVSVLGVRHTGGARVSVGLSPGWR